MTVRARLTLWYAGMLVGSLLLMGAVLHYELVIETDRRTREVPAEKIADVLLFYGLPTVMVLVFGGSWLIRRILRPVETLTAIAERVHAGNLGERIPVSGRGDEIDRLAEVFNAMLARVEAGVSSVREFTLHASHELKTPLTILALQAEAALDQDSRPPEERLLLESQIEEVRRLADLVDALGLLAKADAGLPVISCESLRLDDILRLAVEDTRFLAEKSGITIDITRCDSAPLRGDRARLRQAFLNLVENAVKHNQPGGWVRAELRAEQTRCIVSIENGGPPVPPDLFPRIFERFTRGTASPEGSGLGLSLTQTIIHAHGGTITVVGGAEGGARFTLALPVGEG
jgi:signal transduction histidine kinase